MYEAVEDPYCYPGTVILRNNPGLANQADLDAFEAAATTQRSDEPLPSGRLSVSHYRAIHHHLFQDVYPWAGAFRTVRLGKGGSAFCYPEHIGREMRGLFDDLKAKQHLRGLSSDEFAREAASFLAMLNAIHPFREGNGRTQMSFLALLATWAGHPLDLERLDPEPFLTSMIESFQGDTGALARNIRGLVGDS